VVGDDDDDDDDDNVWEEGIVPHGLVVRPI